MRALKIYSPDKRRTWERVVLWGVALLLAACAKDEHHHIVISCADQNMAVLRDGDPIAWYPVSTSKFGQGDAPGSNATPLGELRVREKIGDQAPSGAVFKSRSPTGEILQPDAPGRDPIVTRILWLEGRENRNRNAHRRFIYIHGTPEERTIGTPSSYGCIRMKSRDVIALFDTVGSGTRVTILPGPLSRNIRPRKEAPTETRTPQSSQIGPEKA